MAGIILHYYWLLPILSLLGAGTMFYSCFHLLHGAWHRRCVQKVKWMNLKIFFYLDLVEEAIAVTCVRQSRLCLLEKHFRFPSYDQWLTPGADNTVVRCRISLSQIFSKSVFLFLKNILLQKQEPKEIFGISGLSVNWQNTKDDWNFISAEHPKENGRESHRARHSPWLHSRLIGLSAIFSLNFHGTSMFPGR